MSKSGRGQNELFRRLNESGLVSQDDFERVYVSMSGGGSGVVIPETQVIAALEKAKLLTSHQAKAIEVGRLNELRIGPYIIEEELGKGGMGRVYKARQALLKRTVALKIIRSDFIENNQAVERFLREIEVLGRLDSPHIVAVEFADRHEDFYYLVMEYVPGVDLHKLVSKQSPLDWKLVCRYTIHAALGLGYAHKKGIIHRDVKPENLFLSDQGIVKVLDFGLAKLMSNASSMTDAGASMGTYDYMSPEQCQDARLVDARTDIYAMGCTLFYLAAGRAVFAHRTTPASKILAHVRETPPRLAEFRPDTPKSLEFIVAKMIAKSPSNRFSSMDEVVEAISSLGRPRQKQVEPVVSRKVETRPHRQPPSKPEAKAQTKFAAKDFPSQAAPSRWPYILVFLVAIIASYCLLSVKDSLLMDFSNCLMYSTSFFLGSMTCLFLARLLRDSKNTVSRSLSFLVLSFVGIMSSVIIVWFLSRSRQGDDRIMILLSWSMIWSVPCAAWVWLAKVVKKLMDESSGLTRFFMVLFAWPILTTLLYLGWLIVISFVVGLAIGPRSKIL